MLLLLLLLHHHHRPPSTFSLFSFTPISSFPKPGIGFRFVFPFSFLCACVHVCVCVFFLGCKKKSCLPLLWRNGEKEKENK